MGMLNKLQTRNVEIKKRKDKGEDYDSYLPDHLKGGGQPEPAPAAEAAETAPRQKRHSSVESMENHLEQIEKQVGELHVSPTPSLTGAEASAEGNAANDGEVQEG